MADKRIELRIPLPIDQCYVSLREIGNGIRGWKNVEANDQNYALKWKQGGGLSTKSPVVTTAVLKATSKDQTALHLTAHHPGLADPFGHLDSALRLLVEPFQLHAETLYEVQTQVEKGMLCPTCGKELPAGVRFCPNDGTLIARECVKCGHNNPLASQYCSNCGAQL